MLYLTLIAIDRCIYWEKNTNINYVAEIATMGQTNYTLVFAHMLYLTLIAIDRCIYWEKNTNINYVTEIATMGQTNYTLVFTPLI